MPLDEITAAVETDPVIIQPTPYTTIRIENNAPEDIKAVEDYIANTAKNNREAAKECNLPQGKSSEVDMVRELWPKTSIEIQKQIQALTGVEIPIEEITNSIPVFVPRELVKKDNETRTRAGF
jgi:hypothetical protein